ncbi:MAG: plasmid pRiA4b ORF-3 family protein [Candidatus Thermoplasmatota archaeon]|nr:plasmid pRiA4b ORF-3 family protein [Candidatus Thermoplasmatota archaeon]
MKNKILQFKISLKDTDPPIWRRILVPATYSFWDLHVAIQDSMGWWDYHLHAFRIKWDNSGSGIEIGIPEDGVLDDDSLILPGWDVDIADYFREVGRSCSYEYDFGDGWIHEILLEAIIDREKGHKYPQCIDGEQACPPEDCGGIDGYYELLDVISNPKHEDYEEMLQWLGGKYDPLKFDPQSVKFDNPKKRWRNAFS